MNARADLHVHSKHSNRPTEWFLRRIGAPESFVEPPAVYRACRERGMQYVTITDHNSIAGTLEIAGLPGTFLSAELTTYFPDDDCKVHCLVYGITEKTFGELQEARASIFDLHRYLNEHRIVHSIAHPLFRVNEKLTVEHFELLLLMFRRFEALNGSRCPRAGLLLQAVVENLTPELMERLAERHGREPTGHEPWKKLLTGGSDDHSGLYLAHAWTETPAAPTVFDFLQHLRDGHHEAGGRAGTSLRLAHSLYHIAYSYYRSRFRMAVGGGDRDLIGTLLRKLGGEPERPRHPVRQALMRPLAPVIAAWKKRRLSDVERVLVEEFQRIRESGRAVAQDVGTGTDTTNFDAACRIGHQLAFAFLGQFFGKLRRGSLVESLQSLSSLGPVLLGVTPYVTAFLAQHKDERFLQSVAARFPGTAGLQQKTGRKAWFTDTLTDVNGVAHTIRMVAGAAAKDGRDLTVITSLAAGPKADFPLVNFEPVGSFALPEYEGQVVVFPPVLNILEHVEREGFDELIISTPGPMGLVALAAARVFQLRTTGIYHTDFPRYVRHLTDDEYLEEAAWGFMQWFYGSMDRVLAPSRFYREQLLARRFSPEKVSVLPRGVDTAVFHPGRRDPLFWKRFGLDGEFKFLFVGRLSKEKNVETLLKAFALVLKRRPGARLVLVGEGPHLDVLRRFAARPEVAFVGHLGGEHLAAAFASADVFVFPSVTDTFGNVVLEAQACGLPAIVSQQGGPAEIISDGHSGLAVDVRSPERLAEAMLRLHDEPETRRRFGEAAVLRARENGWDSVLRQL